MGGPQDLTRTATGTRLRRGDGGLATPSTPTVAARGLVARAGWAAPALGWCSDHGRRLSPAPRGPRACLEFGQVSRAEVLHPIAAPDFEGDRLNSWPATDITDQHEGFAHEILLSVRTSKTRLPGARNLYHASVNRAHAGSNHDRPFPVKWLRTPIRSEAHGKPREPRDMPLGPRVPDPLPRASVRLPVHRKYHRKAGNSQEKRDNRLNGDQDDPPSGGLSLGQRRQGVRGPGSCLRNYERALPARRRRGLNWSQVSPAWITPRT